MIIEPINFINPITGKPEVLQAYFHLNKQDLIQISMENGGKELDEIFQDIANSKDTLFVYNEFKKLISKAYGKKQGKDFIKNDQVSADFQGSEAFSEFIFGFIKDPEKAGVFFGNLAGSNSLQMDPSQPTPADIQEQNVFNARQEDPGPVVNEMPPPVDPSGEANSDSKNATPIPEPVDTTAVLEAQKEQLPRKLTEAEKNVMSFNQIMDGVAKKRWRVD